MKNVFKLIVKNLREYVPINIFRGGQETVYTSIRDAIVKGIRTMYIEGPTGMGKSFIQSTLADAIINGSDLQVLLLVPKITLLTQMQREFMKFAKHLIIGLVGNKHKTYDKQVTVMTYNSFRNVSAEVLKKYSVFFLDEAHKALGEKTKAKILQQEHAIIIGFTATPTYDEKRNLKDFLGHEAYRISIPEAVKVGMLSAIQFIIGKVQIEIVGKRSDETQPEFMERMGKDIIRQGGNIAAAKLYKKIFEKRGTRFIMFTASVYQGCDLVDELRSNGISAEIITGKMNIDDRERLFKRFANNGFKVLVGIDTIKEGFDDAGVHGVLYAYPVNSMVDLIQGAGRSTRIDELFLDKVAYVVQLMFKGKRQVWYNDALEGKGPFVAPDEESGTETFVRRKFNLVSSDDLDGISDEVIESVSVDHEEILNLIQGYGLPEKEFYSTWQEASEATRKIGILSSSQYGSLYKQDPLLPSSPATYYLDFPDWDDFLGRDKSYLTWQQASEAALRLGIKNLNEYKMIYTRDPLLPSSPHTFYKDFPSQPEFFGREKPLFYQTWQEASQASMRLGASSKTEHKSLFKKDSRLPGSPDRFYEDFPGWYVFFGKEKPNNYPTWQEASKAARKLGILSSTQYELLYKKDPRLPLKLDRSYKDFPGWDKFFKREIFYPTWQEASKAARKLGATSRRKYKSSSKENPRLPACPDAVYVDFPDWYTFLGKKK
ncbi:MAG: integrase family protein [Candidatus Nomurabacteria bacterium]|nr:integrase family protein [Candidatus Nomurabacteria bacterium]